MSYDNRLNLRREERDMGDYPLAFASIRSLDQRHCHKGAFAVDLSPSGIGLITFDPYPIGTQITIDMDGDFAAVGEVVNWQDGGDKWQWCGMVRMGIRLLNKVKWPI